MKNVYILLLMSSFFWATDAYALENQTVWAAKYGVSEYDAKLDSDIDGLDDSLELIAGTNPFSKDSTLYLTQQNLGRFSGLEWQSNLGESYMIERSAEVLNNWERVGGVYLGTGALMAVPVDMSEETCFYRVIAKVDHGGVIENYIQEHIVDSDQDGIGNIIEFSRGGLPTRSTGSALVATPKIETCMLFSWQTQQGKYYQIQRESGVDSDIWINMGGIVTGTGTIIEMSTFTADNSNFRVTVTDRDSDQDGLSDWTEYQLGLNPFLSRSVPGGMMDSERAYQLMSNLSKISLSMPSPVANVSTGDSGFFKFKRDNGVAPLTVTYKISGTAVEGRDYQPIEKQVYFPFGVMEIDVEIKPISSSSITVPRNIYMWVEEGEYTRVGNYIQKMSLVAQNSLNVKDFGAIGDGVADDTHPIQDALDALANSSYYNELYFPEGIYKLDSFFENDVTSVGRHHILYFDSDALENRDVTLRGAEGAVLFSTVSPQRAHILVAMAKFRSLCFESLIFMKDETPLSKGNSNGSDGVSIVRSDDRVIESVSFTNCEFNNCHGSVFVYGLGYDVNGKFKNLDFQNCKFLNPFGANTTDIGSVWGGGQQVGMSSWVHTVEYNGCLFEGGSDEIVDESRSPDGRIKDGCHFGSPIELIFTNNVVRNMGVEAVYQLNRKLYLGTTESEFILPPADGVTSVEVLVREVDSTYLTGQIVNVRVPYSSTSSGVNTILRVVAFDEANNILTLVNDGDVGNSEQGEVMPNKLPIYLQIDDGGSIYVANNYMDGSLPAGAERTNPAGLVSDATGRITNNIIINYSSGVLSYKEASVPLYPGSNSMIVDHNYFRLRHPEESPGPVSYGIQTHADLIEIKNNIIIAQLSQRSVGIALRGDNAIVNNNEIYSEIPQDNGYYSNLRSVGILVGNSSYGTSISANYTRGFDVGVGPEPSQWIIHSVYDHESDEDILDVDFRGVVNP